VNAPASYALSAEEAHVWKVPLASTDAAAAGFGPLLCPEERERAERFAFERDRARFISCRASLRLLLGRYLGAAPESIAFRQEPLGKPMLAEGAGWQFNVSHSRDLAAIAIARDAAVGVDLEFIDPAFPSEETAPQVLTSDELRALALAPKERQPAYFFQLWTAKEALLKAAGTGFSVDPRLIHLRLDEGLNPAIVSGPAEFNAPRLYRFSPDRGYAAALAVLGRDLKVGYYSL